MSGPNGQADVMGLVVGRRDDEFVRYTRGLLADFEVEGVSCEDVYEAVVELTRADGAGMIVVGRFEDLCKEGGRFIEMASRKCAACCCLVESEATFRRKGVAEAAAAGALVIQTPGQVEQIVTRVLSRKAEAQELVIDE